MQIPEKELKLLVFLDEWFDEFEIEPSLITMAQGMGYKLKDYKGRDKTLTALVKQTLNKLMKRGLVKRVSKLQLIGFKDVSNQPKKNNTSNRGKDS